MLKDNSSQKSPYEAALAYETRLWIAVIATLLLAEVWMHLARSSSVVIVGTHTGSCSLWGVRNDLTLLPPGEPHLLDHDFLRAWRYWFCDRDRESWPSFAR